MPEVHVVGIGQIEQDGPSHANQKDLHLAVIAHGAQANKCSLLSSACRRSAMFESAAGGYLQTCLSA